jgi:competence protein ComEC
MRNLPALGCSAFILGLALSQHLLYLISLVLLLLTILLFRKVATRREVLILSAIAIIAAFYYQIRLPQPHPQDISLLLDSSPTQPQTIVRGKISSEIRLTSNQRQQFWLTAQSVTISETTQTVGGRVYVTIGDTNTPLYPQQIITLQGTLYQPRSPRNPGEFNFKNYLASQGCFAGLRGEKILTSSPPSWGFWQIRRRIVKAQVQGLGNSYGALLSSLVLGRQAVNLDPQIKDNYIKVGLAHILSASGFQVTLLLGIILKFTCSFTPKIQFLSGLSILLLYLALTGLQPAILRAVVMGLGVLVGLVLQRQVKLLGSLLLAATILLLINPIWIRDLGFQLSFLATLGLIVTAPPLEKHLDWLPNNLISFISIPLAAFIWTFPLIMYNFSVISISSIPLNIIAAPLVVIISLGGMASAFLALLYPPLGSLVASWLYLPLHLLTNLVNTIAVLPFSSYSIGKLSLPLLLISYSIIIFIWLNFYGQKYWKYLGIILGILIILPSLYKRFNLIQLTILSSPNKPPIIIQYQGSNLMINGQEKDLYKYTIAPFLSQEGVNHFDALISANNIEIDLPVKVKINPLRVSQEKYFKGINLKFLSQEQEIIQFYLHGKTWLWINQAHKDIPQDLDKTHLDKYPDVLIWSGKTLNLAWLNILQPRQAIATTKYVDFKLKKQLKKLGITWYSTSRDGAIQWQPEQGLKVIGEVVRED